jgi:hypothetical protein
MEVIGEGHYYESCIVLLSFVYQYYVRINSTLDKFAHNANTARETKRKAR